VAISRRQRVADALVGRLLRQAPARTDYAVGPVRSRMRDGTELAGDHYGPRGGRPRGTVLIRTPYGRGFPTSSLNGRLLAARGYHVLIQSVRGTFGSGGRIEPMAQETEDGLDTVAWLREQEWFDGRLATLGGSYLGWTQWAILQDPPPELRTSVIYVGPHDFRASTYGTGAFTLGDFLGWSFQITRQEDNGGLRRLLDTVAAGRRLRPVYAGLPLPEAAETVLRGRAPWYREWATRTDASDPWWEARRAGAALERVTTPILLVSGWQDLFLEQTLEQFAVLTGRGLDVGLTVGPWTHLEVGSRAEGRVSRETVAWLDEHMAGGPPARRQPVSVFRTGERRWHDLPSWPPPSSPAVFRLHRAGTLTLIHPTAGETENQEPAEFTHSHDAIDKSENDRVIFRYDPSDPTPTVGGRTLSGSMGVKDNRPLEARPDVRAFTTDPLPTAVDVIGSPVLDLAISADTRHADVFVRLCDVDERGHSRNFSDLMHRLDPAVPAGEVHHLHLTLDACFHRLRAGHRLRLLVTGGSFPRYARAVDDSGALTPSHRTVHCHPSRLTLPVAPPPPSVGLP
jgi:putative CocE/NonD family hydrolase